MKSTCESCGKVLPENLSDETCPFCGYLTKGLPPMSTMVSDEGVETEVATVAGLPTISSVESGDDTYLKKGVMIPPNRPGIRGNLGRFELLKLLGRGGMGFVYLAREPLTDTQVAVKILRQELAEHPKVKKYFMSEARHMYAMSHPNILKVLEVSESERGPFFVMPYIRGGSLRDRLEDKQALSRAEITTIGSQVAKGLVYAHSRGLLHRDLKPDNVLIDDQQRVMITDFGLVRSYLDDTLVDVSQSSAEGTPAYMSPGVAAGQAEDTRCDIYAFGAMMYEMLTGKTPYSGPSAENILDAIRSGPPPEIHKVNPDASKALTTIAAGAMARELRDRYATMADVLEDLERVEQGQRPLGPYTQAARRKLPESTKVLMPLLGMLLLVLVLYWVMKKPNQSDAVLATVPEKAPLPEPTPTAEPVPVDERYAAGVKAFNENFYLDAKTALEEVVVADPAHADAWMILGDTYLKMGHTLSARISYDKVNKLRGENVEALVGMSNAFALEGRPHYFTLYLTKAFNLDPTNEEVTNRLIPQLIKIGHVNPVKRNLQILKDADPDNPSIPLWEDEIAELEAALISEDTSNSTLKPSN